MRAEQDTQAEAFVVTATKGSRYLSKLPPLVLQARRVLERTPVGVVAVVVGLVTLLVHGYRLSAAPDVFSDEGLYLLVGANVARGIGLVVNGSVFMWHSPAYMLVEAAYIKLAGLTNTDPLATLLSVRYLDIFFSATTAALLMLFGRKLHSYKAGLIIAALFLMDPYVQRINRRGMLETLAMLCVLLGLYIFFTHRPRLTKWQRLSSGIAFGLAMLTKEPMYLELLALIVYVAWFRRSQLRDVAWVAAIACVVYLPYPAWAIAVGQGKRYLSFQLYNITRVLDLFRGNHPPSPPPGEHLVPSAKISFLDTLGSRLTQYGASYLLLALAAIFMVILIIRFRHLVAVRYLITWYIFSFGFGLTLGSVSDQYFYFLIVPSTIVAGYTVALLLETVVHSRSAEKASILNQSRAVFPLTAIEYRMMWRPIFAVFCVILLYNSYVWTKTYAVGSDDAYINIIKYVRTQIPRGTTIVTSDDVALYFLSPSYNIRLDRDTKMIMDTHESYFIMSSKDAWAGYDATTQGFYDWVMQHSRPLFEQYDPSFWKLGIYQFMATPTPTPAPPPSVLIQPSYLGILYDIPAGLKTNISLTSVRQQQWNMSGYFGGMPENRLLKGMPENGPITGTINAARQIQFIVTSSTGQATFSFQGVIQPDGSIAGTYCSLEASAGNCSDYGLWSVSPASHDAGAGPAGSSYPTQRAAQPTIVIPTASPDRKGTVTT